MASAGQQLVAGRVPGERIATTTITVASSTFTSDTQVASVAADLVSGRTYRVTAHIGFQSTVADDRIIGAIRPTSSSTASIRAGEIQVTRVSATVPYVLHLEVEYTASATGSKTFVVTAQRVSGTGNCRLEAASNNPSYLYVDYIRG